MHLGPEVNLYENRQNLTWCSWTTARCRGERSLACLFTPKGAPGRGAARCACAKGFRMLPFPTFGPGVLRPNIFVTFQNDIPKSHCSPRLAWFDNDTRFRWSADCQMLFANSKVLFLLQPHGNCLITNVKLWSTEPNLFFFFLFCRPTDWSSLFLKWWPSLKMVLPNQTAAFQLCSFSRTPLPL